ncbi:MAG: transglycosylase domain-containing protein [Clostridia bacterium]|nr:transglycosylase domain-containing protein [Clostridia bacterium]
MKKVIGKLLFVFFILLLLAGIFLFLIGYGYYSNTLHDKSLTKRVEAVTSKEHYVPFHELPENYIHAVIAVEDHRYYNHGPIDLIGIARAFYTNIRDGKFDEGGSTITQQVAKNIIFHQDKTLIRKLGEVFGAYDLEKNYTKQEIFALYVNSSYFGDGYYCIYDASMGYFNKEPKDLNLGEASMLAGVPNAPSVYSPTVNPDLAKKRQSHVLNKMVEYGYITQEEANTIP